MHRHRRWFEPTEDAIDPRRQPSVGEPKLDVGFVDRSTQSERARGNHHATAREAAESDDQIHSLIHEYAPRDADRLERMPRRATEAHDVCAPDRTSRNGCERLPRALQDRRGDRARRAEEYDVRTRIARAQGFCDRQRWIGVARGITHDQADPDADAAHVVQHHRPPPAGPRVCARLWRDQLNSTMQAAVIVLGDLGRSPRMQYHAVALAVNGIDVDLIGEEGDELPTIVQHPRIQIHRLKARRGFSGAAASALALFWKCLRIRRPDLIIVQTPPAVPTMIVAWAAAKLRGGRLVFDWHNLGWTVLRQRLGAAHPMVTIARALERAGSRLADAHVVVSEALAHHLRTEWRLTPVCVLRDRPAEAFMPRGTDNTMRARLLRQAGFNHDAQPAIVISPSSWTSDDAQELVLSAAADLEDAWSTGGPADGIVIVMSGHGSGRAAFEKLLEARSPRRVRIITTWVSGDEYPALIASADAGLSLHCSSSGLDLPMKICDMFGAALPVCALDYGATLRELVDPNNNALLFADARGLAACLDSLFRSWPVPSALWQRLQIGAQAVAAGPRWMDGWQQEAGETMSIQRAKKEGSASKLPRAVSK